MTYKPSALAITVLTAVTETAHTTRIELGRYHDYHVIDFQCSYLPDVRYVTSGMI